MSEPIPGHGRRSKHDPAPGTVRWRLDISYDGTDFSGWAHQPDLRTVQGTLEDWIGKVLRLDEPIGLTVAGRTDAGVHARGQVAHIDLPDEVDGHELHRRLRRVLETDLSVHHITRAPAGFDARFSAIWRRYVYRMWDQDSSPDPLLRGHVTRVRGRLDIDRMSQGAQLLLGLRDFAPFCKAREGATTIRTLLELQAERGDDATGTVAFTVVADAFCHSMVRSLMGAMTEVGSGHRDLAWLGRVMTSPVRHNEVPVMAARGLCLEEVGYPADDQLAARALVARSFRSPEELGVRADTTKDHAR